MQYEFAKAPSYSPAPTPNWPTTQPPTGQSDAGKIFTVEIFPAPDYKHRTRIGLSPLHGPWPDERNPFCDKRSFAQFALKAAIPANLASRGMVDWETGGQVEVVEEDKLDRLFQINARQQRKDQRELARDLDARAEEMGRTTDEPKISDEATDLEGTALPEEAPAAAMEEAGHSGDMR